MKHPLLVPNAALLVLVCTGCSGPGSPGPSTPHAQERLASFSQPDPDWHADDVAAHQVTMETEARDLVQNPPHDPQGLFSRVGRGEFEHYEDYANRLAELSDAGWFTFDVPIAASRYLMDDEAFLIEFDALRSSLDQTLKVRIDTDLQTSDFVGQTIFGTKVQATRTVGEVYTLMLYNWSPFTQYCPQVLGVGDLGTASVAGFIDPARAQAVKPSLGLRFVVEILADPTMDYVEERATFTSPAELEAQFHRLPANLAMIIVYDRATGEIVDVLPGPPPEGRAP